MRSLTNQRRTRAMHQRWTAMARWAAPMTLALAAGTAHAQFRASIQGTVTDTTGAVVPNATVTLIDQATNKTLTATSSADGIYNFNALPADHFKLTATAAGFQAKVIQDLTIIPEQANSVNVQLALGTASTTVDVSGDTVSAVDTQTANIGGTITSNDIQHLPSFNRDVFTLTQLVPGAISDGAQAGGGGVYNQPGNQGPGGSGNGGSSPTENGPQANANGQQYGTNGISIDGISTVSAVWGGTTIITPTEDSIDNVRIVTNDYDAENGRFSGAQTMVTSKSGTNQLHGSAFIAIHRPGLNAYQRRVPGADPLRDTQRFNQYGGSLGGPIWKNKVFAFFAYESSPNSSTSTAIGWYETPAFQALAPSNSISSTFLNFPGNAVSSTAMVTTNCADAGLTEGVNCRAIAGQGLNIGSPLTAALGSPDPSEGGTPVSRGLGGGLSNVADIAEYVTESPYNAYYRQFNGRMDADVTGKDHLAFAIYWVPQGNTQYNGGARSYNIFHHDQINDAFAVIWNHTFSANFLNEARANAAGWRWNEIASNPQQPVGLPQDSIEQIGSVTLGQFGSSLGSDLNQWTYGYKDVATKIAGRHTIKFGGDVTQLHYLNNPIGRPNYAFYNVWDFLNDAPRQEAGAFNTLTGQPGGVRSDDRENLLGFFVQDGWKAAPNLTLNAGMRYSYFGSLYAKQNNLSVIQFGSGSSLFTGIHTRIGGGLYSAPKGNFGPQLGFNWSPEALHGRMVLRGGYGLNFNQIEIALTANAGNNPPTQAYDTFAFASPNNPGANGKSIVYGVSSSPTSLTGFAPNPNAITTYNSAGLPTAGSASITAFGNLNGTVPTPYAHHYSLETSYEVGRELVASVGYQGSSSHHLINHQSPNSAAVVAGAPLNPLIPNGGGDYWTSAGAANNNALLIEVKHPMLHRFSLDAQYQYAKSLDTDGSGPYYEDEYFPLGAGYSYGRSDFNVGQSFKVFGLWQPVFFHGSNSWAEKIAGGWSLSGIMQIHSGFPWTPNYSLSSSLYCPNCGYNNLRPVYMGGAKRSGSNAAFEANKGEANSNFFNPGTPVQTGNMNNYANNYFVVGDYTAAVTNNAGGTTANVALPPLPGSGRNTFDGPRYRDVDGSLTKGFGIPNTRLLGESARLEIRADVFNVFNLLNLNTSNISTNINADNFGRTTGVLGARTVTFQGRFSF